MKNSRGTLSKLWLLIIIFESPFCWGANENPSDDNQIENGQKLKLNGFKSEDLDFWTAPSELKKDYPYYHAGYDTENHPIWVEEAGRWNYRKMVEEGGDTFKTFDKYVEQSFYNIAKSASCQNESGSSGDNPDDCGAIVIVDLDGLEIHQIAHLPTLSFLLNMMRTYRPVMLEHTYQCFIINTNAIGMTVLNLMRPILGRVMERFQIYGTNPQKWTPQLLKYCPKNSLPPWYGGSEDFKPIKLYG